MMVQTSFAGYGVSLEEKTERAIALLREHESKALELSPNGYWLAFSGGKDSCVIDHLAKWAGVKHRKVYNQTTIDPPELVRFIKQFHPDTEWNRPKRNFFKAMIESHGVPSRLVRWCCEEFKEKGGDGMVRILGVRKAESSRRKQMWMEISPWRSDLGGFVVCPIVDWSDADVWQYIRQHKLPYCSLYDEGWKRLGCIGCPMAGQKRWQEFERWPRFGALWKSSISKYWQRRHGVMNRFGEPYYSDNFKSGEDFFLWWMSDNPTPQEEDQECLGLYDA